MIPVQYYNFVYCIILGILLLPIISKYQYPVCEIGFRNNLQRVLAVLLTITCVLYIGFRPDDIEFGDMLVYWWGIEKGSYQEFEFSSFLDNYAFMTLMSTISSLKLGPRFAIVVLAIINYCSAFIAMRKLYPKDTYFAMIVYASAFGTFAGAVNGIKNGCALALFLCAIAYKDSWKTCLMFLLLSLGFHHAMEITIASFIACLFVKNSRYYLIFWVVSLFMALFHITFFQTYFAGFTDEHGAEYLITTEDSWVTGFRLDFIIFSLVPIVFGWYLKYKEGVFDKEFDFIYNVYVMINGIWLLCMHAAFTNRFASLSWAIIPILTLYPLLKLNLTPMQLRWNKTIIHFEFLFALFMCFINTFIR